VSAGCSRTGSDSDKDTPKGQRDSRDRNPESDQPDKMPTAKQILEWVPADRETFVVVNGPFQMQLEGEKLRRRNTLAGLLEGISYSPLAMRNGAFIKELAGQEVALGVEAARRFRPPSGLGMSRYEGCHIIVFRHDLGAAGDSLKKALAAAAKKTQKIAGHEVFSLEEKFEKDVWHIFFAQPQANILVCATDQGFLSELLERMVRPTGKRALPKNLPEWKHVQTTARFWAVRHFDDAREGDLDSPPATDPGVVGLVFIFDLGEGPEEKAPPKVIYLSGEKDVRKVEKAWTYVGEAKWTPKVKQLAPGVIELTAELKGDGDAGRFFIILLYHLGHAIAV
jgi:hypothetical protein